MKFHEFDWSRLFLYTALFTTGQSHYFKDIDMKKIIKNFNSAFRINYTKQMKLKEIIKRLYIKPILGKKWFLYLEYDDLKSADRDILQAYLKKPSKYALVLANSKNYKVRKGLLRNRFIAKSEKIELLDYEYPSWKYLSAYIKDAVAPKKIGNREVDLMIDRLSTSYDEYGVTLELINGIPDTIITKDIIMALVEDMAGYGINRLVDMLVKRDKKTLPIKALFELLNNKKPSEILGLLKYNFQSIERAKQYIICGLLAPNGNLEEDKKYIKDDSKILKLRNKYLNRFLLLANCITYKEIRYINILLGKFNWVSDDDHGIADLYSIILFILGRDNKVHNIYTDEDEYVTIGQKLEKI